MLVAHKVLCLVRKFFQADIQTYMYQHRSMLTFIHPNRKKIILKWQPLHRQRMTHLEIKMYNVVVMEESQTFQNLCQDSTHIILLERFLDDTLVKQFTSRTTEK